VRGSVALAAILAILLVEAFQDALGLQLAGFRELERRILLDPVALALMLLVGLALLRRSRLAIRHRAPGEGVPVLELVPLAVAVLGVQFVVQHAWTLLGSWTASVPLHRLGMGGALLVALLALILLVPRFRADLWEYASLQRLRKGLYFTVSVLVVVYGILLWLGVAVAGPKQVHLQVPRVLGVTVLLVMAQAIIALGEEIFYRGVLQGEVSRLLVRAGMGNPRDRRLVSVGAVSVLFGLEHVGPGMTREVFLATFLYAFAMSVLFGFLFHLTGNLAVCSLAHLFNNLTVLGLGPAVTVPGPMAAFPEAVYLTSFLAVTFVFLFLLGRDRNPSLEPIRPN
jgi:membrane protease YdiL (CAAX protease family)